MHRPQRYATRQPRPPYGSHPPRGPPPYGHPPRGPPPRGPPPPFAPSPYGPPPPRGPSSGPPPRGPSSGPPPRGPSRGPPPRGPSSGLPPRGPSSGPPPRGPSSGPPPRGPSSGPPPRGPSSGPPPRGPSSGPPSLMDLPARAPAPKAPLLATPPSGPQSGPGPRGPPPRGPHPESRSTAASANPQGDQQRSQEHQKKLRELEELQKKQIAQLEALAQEHLKQKEDTPPPLPPPLPPKESPPRPPPLPPQPPEPEPVNPQELPDDLRRGRENAERLYLQEIDRKKEDERSRIAHIDHLRRVVDEEKGNLARKQEQQRPRARPPQHDPYAPRDDPYAPHDPYAPRDDPYAHKDDPYAPRADPYAPKRDPYAPPEDPYAPKRDPYAPPEDPYAPKRDPYAPRVDPYARKDDPYADGLDLYAPENDPYAPQNDPFAPKARDPYAPKPRDPYAPPRGPPLPPPLPREPLSRGPAPAPRGHPPVPRAPEGRRPPLHGADRMEYDDYDDYPPPKSLPHPRARRPDPYDDPYAEAARRDPYLDDYPLPARGRGRGAYGVVAHQPPPPPRRPSPPSLSGIQEKLLEQSRKIYETEPGIDSYNTKAPPKPQPKKPEPEKPRPNEEATASKPEKANVQEEEDEVDWSSCQICDIKFTKQNAYWVHVRGLAHYQKVEEKSRQKNDEAAKETEEAEGEDEDQPDWAWCHYCSEKFKTEEAYTEHQSSQKHIVLKREHTRLTNPAPPKSDAEIKFLVEGLSQAYYCDVCDVNCNAEQSWYAHLAGKQHKKKLKRQGELDRAKKLVEAKEAAIESSVESSHTVTSKMPHQPPKRTNVKGDPYIDQVKDSAQPFKVVQQKKLMIGTLIEGTEEALIGMDYMTEFQRQGSNEEPRYTCELCESKMDQRQVINHLIGIKHRMKYFKHHYIKYYDALYYVKKSSDKTAKAKKYAETVVKIEGVQQMRVKVELDPFVNQPQYKGSAVATLPDGSKWVEVAGSNCRPEDELPGLAKKKEMKSKLDKFKYESDASESDEDLGPPRSKRRREDSDDDEDRYHRDPYMRDRYDRDPYRGGRDSRDPYARANDPYAPANDPYLRSSSPPPGPSRDPFGLGEPGRDRDMRDRDMRDRDMRDRDMRDRDMRDRDDRDPYRRDPYAGREYSVVDLPMGPAAGQNILSRHPNAPVPPPQPKPSPELMVRAMQHPTLAALDVNLLRSVVAAVGNPTPAAQANHMALNKDEILNTALRNPSLSGVDRGLLHSIVDTLSRIPGSGPPSSTAAAYPPPSSSLPLHSSTGDAAYPPPSSSLPLYSSTVTAPPVRYGAAAGAGKAGAQKPFPAPSAAGAGASGKSGAHKPFPCPSSSSSTQKLVTSPFATKKSRDSLTTKSAKMAIEKVIKYLKGAEADMPKEDVEATEQATALLRSLSQCVIASEQDAKITLEICNALTKSMVDYKIQRVTNKNNANKTLKLHLDQFNKSAKLVAKFGKR